MQAPHKCPAVAWVSNPELCGWLYRNKARKNGKRYLDMVEKNRNDGQKLEGSVSFFNHCFELISLLCLKKRSLKACVNIHHQSVQFFKVQTDPETFQESSCILQKKRKKTKTKKTECILALCCSDSGQMWWMNTWLWIKKMKYYFKIGKSKTLWSDLCVCVFSFLQNTDQTTRWRSVRAVDQTATTPNTWTRSSAPSKVCMSCVCVWVGCTGVPVCEGVERKQVCVCAALNPGSPEALWSLHGSFKVQFHVSALVSIRLCVGWKYVVFSLCVLSVAF